MMNLKNYYLISDRIATSGQPSREQFRDICNAGYEVVINLALENSPDAIENEQTIVQKTGMTYAHIPVSFESPSVKDLKQFFKVMDENTEHKVLVHCAYNWRVSVFMYLYRTIRLGESEDLALHDLEQIWQPDEIWQEFIQTSIQVFQVQGT